jgi:hypothetical protein
MRNPKPSNDRKDGCCNSLDYEKKLPVLELAVLYMKNAISWTRSATHIMYFAEGEVQIDPENAPATAYMP